MLETQKKRKQFTGFIWKNVGIYKRYTRYTRENEKTLGTVKMFQLFYFSTGLPSLSFSLFFSLSLLCILTLHCLLYTPLSSSLSDGATFYFYCRQGTKNKKKRINERKKKKNNRNNRYWIWVHSNNVLLKYVNFHLLCRFFFPSFFLSISLCCFFIFLFLYHTSLLKTRKSLGWHNRYQIS